MRRYPSGYVRRLYPVIVLSVSAVAILMIWTWERSSEIERLENCKRNEVLLGRALMAYWDRSENGQFPMTLGQLVPNFLAEIPKCPSTLRPYTYQSFSDLRVAGDYLLSCPGHHRGIVSGFPKVSSVQGTPCTDPTLLLGSNGRAAAGWHCPTR